MNEHPRPRLPRLSEITSRVDQAEQIEAEIREAAFVAITTAVKPREAPKNDQGKTRLELLPWDALNEVADALAHGAPEYGDWGWTAGVDWSRRLGSALRHVAAFAHGQDTDPKSGCPHLALGIAQLLFLLSHAKTGAGRDDRRSRFADGG